MPRRWLWKDTGVYVMQQYQYEANVEVGAGAVIAIVLVALALTVFAIASWWRVFSKAGQPGWAAIIPIYNTIVMLRVAGKPWWWLVLMLIPVVNIILLIIVYLDIARSFGKGAGFGVLMIFFPYICIPVLAFGSARYVGLGGTGGGQPPYPGQPYPGGPYPGQPYPGQPYPGQQYAGAPQSQPYPAGQPGANPYAPNPQYPGQPPYPPQ